jgi:hypothetical protein
MYDDRVCNVKEDAEVTVHMILMRGNLPHPVIINPVKSALHVCICKFLPSEGVRLHCDVSEMEACMVDISITGDSMWQKWAAALEKLTRKSEDEYAEALSAVKDAGKKRIIENTNAKIKVTHFGSVSIQYTWSRKREGQLVWDEESIRVIRCMSSMIMRFLEICT